MLDSFVMLILPHFLLTFLSNDTKESSTTFPTSGATHIPSPIVYIYFDLTDPRTLLWLFYNKSTFIFNLKHIFYHCKSALKIKSSC